MGKGYKYAYIIKFQIIYQNNLENQPIYTPILINHLII